MSAYVVWVDTEHAKVFKLATSGVESKNVKNHHHNHHGYNPRDQHPDHEKYYHEVAEHVKDASELLILGPGLGKDHFKKHLDSHHASLAKKVVGIETTDHPTDNQILAYTRKFFKSADLFNKPSH